MTTLTLLRGIGAAGSPRTARVGLGAWAQVGATEALSATGQVAPSVVMNRETWREPSPTTPIYNYRPGGPGWGLIPSRPCST